MTEPLSARAYASAMRMYEQHTTMARPRPEDFAHLDESPPAVAAADAHNLDAGGGAAAASLDSRVRATLQRMQDGTGVQFTGGMV